MAKAWVALAALFVALVPTTDGRIISTSACVLPAYEHAPGIAPYATPDEYAAIIADETYRCDRIVYESDSLPVVAYFYAPRDTAASPRPLVVFNRGSYIQPEIAHQLVPLFHRLAERGFAIVAPMLRGSAGAPGTDEMGGADLHDVMNVVPLATNLRSVDASRLFLYGESRGGAMTLMAIKNGFPARARRLSARFRISRR